MFAVVVILVLALAACDVIAGDSHRLEVKRSGAGQVTSTPGGIDCGPNCSSSFPAGSTVTLEAQQLPGIRLQGWAGACEATSPAHQCVVRLNRDTIIHAYFEPSDAEARLLTVQKQGDGSGRVTSEPEGIDCGQECVAAFEEGEAVELVATSDPGSSFASWDGCDSVDGPACVVELDDDKLISAVFVLDEPGVHSVSVQPSSASLEVGDEAQFAAQVIATGGVDESVSWQSSAPSVAAVSATGLVTAVAAGVAEITATSNFDQDHADTASVTVQANADGTRIQPVASTCDGVGVGDTCTVEVALFEADDQYAGFEFEVAAAGFQLLGVQAGDGLPANDCFVASGERKVAGVCTTPAVAGGQIAVLDLQRDSPSATTLIVHDAHLAASDAESKTEVAGGTIAIQAAD